MSNRTVYATSTLTARMHDTARRGINRVSCAPLYWCGICGTRFSTDRAVQAHIDAATCEEN